MTAAYFNAAIPEPFRILGLKLKPLSLGRYRLMRRHDVAFVDDASRDADVSDLLLGVLICSMRVDEFAQFVDSRTFHQEIARWKRKTSRWGWLGCLPVVGRWFARRNSFNAVQKILLFQQYIAAHTEAPKYWDMSQSDGGSGSHWSHAMEVALRGELGWTKEEIDEEPLSKAIADYFKLAEDSGSVRLMNDWELQMIADLERANGAGA
jgi:hypothetical protein